MKHRSLLTLYYVITQRCGKQYYCAKYSSQAGKTMLVVNGSTKNSLSVVVHRRSGADRKEIAKAFAEALQEFL